MQRGRFYSNFTLMPPPHGCYFAVRSVGGVSQVFCEQYLVYHHMPTKMAHLMILLSHSCCARVSTREES